ncbi:hypothetical protein C5167_037123 [Papaver somniferum]|uniref:C2H2-type domain-containing protein n=1 Tax=Papaver somniferum TaxID=3469 RepID=A0A4Y7I814_PAPSO|nr:zinc finger protein 385B-like [Papaver somniferum]RZC44176.1 hypothetical protein C5167_037123 [Papaver somniferum]
MGSSFPSHDNIISLGGYAMDGASFPPRDHNNIIPLGGGYAMNGARISEPIPTSNPFEMIQREQEKERIREEIIAAEMMRLQTLEAEVKKELAIERELKLQREIAKPTSSLARINGKLVAVGGSGFHQKELTCDLCQVSVKSELDLHAHITGKKHKENEASSVVEANPLIANIPSNPKKAPYKEFTCHICDVSMTSEQSLIDHVNGKKHKAKRQHRLATRTLAIQK